MKNEYKIKNKKVTINFLLMMAIIFSTCFLAIGYAAINPITLDIDGTAVASAQEGVFIANAVYDSNIDGEQQYSKINNYIQTTLNSSISLSNSNPNSSITYAITIYNNTNLNYFFIGTSYLEKFYDNLGITYDLEGIKEYDVLEPQNEITFNITFRYKDNTIAESNELNSYIEFLFEPIGNRLVVELIYKDEIKKQIISLTEGTTIFDVSGIEGTVIRCNNGAIPTITDDTITISEITANTICKIFDTLEEAIETSDTSINNMLMIANEESTFEDTNNIIVTADKKINLDINGMEINTSTSDRTINYIENYGILKVSDSKGSGYIKSNYRVIGNLENGELTIDSGTYKRTAGDIYCGGTITNFGGVVMLRNSTLTATSTAAFLNWGEEESISLIDNCTLYTETGDTIINGSYDSEISISNSIITSSSGAAFKGAYLLTGESDKTCGPIYVCNSTLSGIFDYYVPGLGRFYYASNVTFMNGGNTPYSNKSDSLIKNYTTTTNNEWYKVKSKTTDGQKQIAKYANGKIIRVGDKIKISTLLSTNYALEVSEFVNSKNIQLYTKDSIDGQEFILLASSLEDYYAIAVYSVPTKCFSIINPIQSGSKVDLYTYYDEEYERFELISYGSTMGYYHINSIKDIYLDIEGKVAADSQNIIIYTPDETDSQNWKIERVE